MLKIKKSFSLLLALLCLCMASPGAAAPAGISPGPAPFASQVSGRFRRVQRRETRQYQIAPARGSGRSQAEIPAESAPVLQEAQFTAYAYCACTRCCGQWARSITASGTTATEGRTIAVDPDVIPLGTHVYVNGREYIAEDTGSGIRDRTIDVFFESHQEALQWGKRTVTVQWPA